MGKARAKHPHLRRHWLVNPPLQYQFVGMMLLVLLLLTIGSLGSVYVALWITMHTFQLAQDPVAVAQMSTVGLLVTLELLVLAPVVVWVGIRMTHRVAGPLVRINAGLQQLARGDFNVHLKLRDGDALGEVADAVNLLASSLRSRR